MDAFLPACTPDSFANARCHVPHHMRQVCLGVTGICHWKELAQLVWQKLMVTFGEQIQQKIRGSVMKL